MVYNGYDVIMEEGRMRATSMKEIVRKMTDSQEYVIFMLGDSITCGACASTAETTYTAIFAKGLAKRYPERTVLRYDGLQSRMEDGELRPVERFDGPVAVGRGESGKLTVVRCGIGGNTVRRILNRRNDYAGREFEGRRGDLFFIMLGINDSLQKDSSKYVTPEQYQKDLRELLDLLALTNPEADVVLMTPTYYHDGKTPTSYLDFYAEKMKEVAKEQSLPLIDFHKLWMDHMVLGGEGNGQGDWLPRDKCHPGDKGHRIMGEEILRHLFF
jgi:lysophospholipase L1-like esterase